MIRLKISSTGTAVSAIAVAWLMISPSPAQETTGDAERGQALFTQSYKCYACHGFDAQTGQRRLKPMSYTQQGFTTFVKNSPLPLMPAYPDVTDGDLADIYAYILSIPVDAPEIGEVPLLQSILNAKLEYFEDSQ